MTQICHLLAPKIFPNERGAGVERESAQIFKGGGNVPLIKVIERVGGR